jgi:integrase
MHRGRVPASPRLAKVHWQAGDRPLPPPQVSIAGESALWVDPAEIPADADIARLGQALAAGRHGDRDELMAVTAAYSGLRWGELTALTVPQVATPAGYLLAERLAARAEQARAEQATGTNPLGLVFPSPTGKHWRSSNFSRNVLKAAYLAVGWRDSAGSGEWTWHSLRHVFCTTALFTWKLDATDVSRMAGHANYRITLDMDVGTTADVLDRARTATQ